MRLWVDGQCLQTASRLRGIGRYVTELLRAITENHPEVELSISFNAAMPEEALLARKAVEGFVAADNIHVWHGAATDGEAVEGYTPERQLSELAISHHVNCLAPDVALSASPFEGAGETVTPLLPDRGCEVPVASIFYDAIPHRYPDRYLSDSLLNAYYRRRLAAYSEFADNLCISKFSKSELESIHPGISAHTIDAGISRDFAEIAEAGASGGNDHGQFVLYVGGFDWRKNIIVLAEAFAILDRLRPGNRHNLVLAGDGPGVLVDEVAAHWKRGGLEEDRMVRLGHVSNEKLVSLYRQAKVLVQPSFMEGFGLTALEAIRCGTPVAAARAGALPEVIGVDALLFDPTSPDELARILMRLLEDGEARARLAGEAQAHAAHFTWARSAGMAVRRLAALAGRAPVSDRNSLRGRIVGILDRKKVDGEAAARAFALSEPVPAPPRLLVDVTSTARIDHKTGIQRVVKNISAAQAERNGDGIERYFVYCDDEKGWFPVDGCTLKKPGKNALSPIMFGRDIFLTIDSSWEFHALHGRYLRACRLQGGQVITGLHDLVPFRMAAFCNPSVVPVFKNWFCMSLAYSTGFVCVSRAVADELYILLDAISFPRRMKVGFWHHGADFIQDGAMGTGLDEAPESRRPFFLMVGTLEPRKGHRVALEAFEQLWASGFDADLVIVGKEGWGVEALIRRIRAHPEHGRRLVWHHRADDATLAGLYARCDALVAASFGEGFGLPLVEAGHFGKPVIASDIPVFREVGEGAAAATYFEVGSPEALAGAVRDFVAASASRPEKAGRKPWQTWRESAAQLEDVVLGGNWYKTYEPRERREYVPLDDLGHVIMKTPLSTVERAHSISHIEGPDLIDDGRMLKITVSVTNLSSSIWSSRGDSDGLLGVNLSYHILDGEGMMLQYDNARTAIPFVHIPGDTMYMPIVVPADWKERGAVFIDIELVQEGVAWFGNALRVTL